MFVYVRVYVRVCVCVWVCKYENEGIQMMVLLIVELFDKVKPHTHTCARTHKYIYAYMNK